MNESATKKIAGKDIPEKALDTPPEVIAKFCAVLELLGDDARKVKEFWDLWDTL